MQCIDYLNLVASEVISRWQEGEFSDCNAEVAMMFDGLLKLRDKLADPPYYAFEEVLCDCDSDYDDLPF